MPEFNDPAIKLFGKTIQLTGDIKKSMEKEHVDGTSSDQSTSIGINDDPKTPIPHKEIPSKNTAKKDNPIDNLNPSNPDDKAQKPDKILPCPRCNSVDTKFCYYNNYNVNQPRHFCKNCQRYWTDGGTMRNTPVGSGRRKNKSFSSASYYRHLIINDGSDVPLCGSINQDHYFSDKLKKSEDDGSSSTSNLLENGGNFGNLWNLPKHPVKVPCFSSPPPWFFPWNSAPPTNFYPTPNNRGCTVQVPMPMPLRNPNSPLGKHSRDGNLLPLSSNSGNEEPLNHPKKAVKSAVSINGGILSKAFHSKIDETSEVSGSSLANLQANPAALSRSLNFHETS